MKLIVCVEDRWGLLFNHRRVSRDRAVTDKILSLTAGSSLLMNEYSSGLFPAGSLMKVDPCFLEKAETGDCCFVETDDIRPFLSRVEELVLFRWNRKYPFDVSFPFEDCFGNWNLISREDFPGNSHEMITMEVYRP